MQPVARRVVKVGGSLFACSELAPALRAWLAEQSPATNILLAGGGALADVVRDWDARFQLGQARAHWLCVEVLRVTARLLTDLLPECRLVTDFGELRGALQEPLDGRAVVFCPAQFLREVEATLGLPPLPQTWDVTSDSLAARLAEALSARELVLLKSSDPPAAGLAGTDYVDEYFAEAARNIPTVRFVNLRANRKPA
ncbi:MAG: hypothetical protein NTY19_00115 [Planctomycetota bacterium]|nr:hypothetical protein [Planctomycetota bacterium]